MPAVVRDLALPTLYLDWSHLSKACLLLPDWADLTALLRSGTANLCVSFVHLVELLAWPDHVLAVQVAAVLDQLPIIWIESSPDIEANESKRALLRALGADLEPYHPFLRGFLSLFSDALTPAKTPEMLANPFVSTLFAQNKGRSDLPLLLVQSLVHARDLLHDRRQAEVDGVSDDELRSMSRLAWPYNANVVLRSAHQKRSKKTAIALATYHALRQRNLGRRSVSSSRTHRRFWLFG